MINPQVTRLLFIVLILNTFNSIAQLLPTTTDISYLYQPTSEIQIKHQLVSSNSEKWLLLEIDFNDGFFDSLAFSFSFTEKLKTPIRNFTELTILKYQFYEIDNTRFFAIQLNQSLATFWVLNISPLNETANFTYIVNLKKTAHYYISKTQPTLPLLNGFAPKDTPLKIVTLKDSVTHFNVFYYSKPFSTARPPTSTSKQPNPFTNADTTFRMSEGGILPSGKTGTYTLFKDDDENHIGHFKIVDTNYPQFTSINELIDASIYLFTKKERTKFEQSIVPKKDFDDFWIKNTNSPKRASKTISAYFARVKQANSYFTSFKEGWKSDMGMIYIIFGAPNKVFRTDEGMEWVYKKTYELPKITFNFLSNSSIITSEYYILERNTHFQSIWFRAIDLWRKGRKNL